MADLDVISLASTTVSVVEGNVFRCLEGDTLLRGALRAGVPVVYECNSGGCGSCKFKLDQGEVVTVDERPLGLTERDHRKGRLLACQTIPTSDCTVSWPVGSEPTGHPRPRRVTSIVTDIRPLTHDMREITVRSAGPAAFLPGQFAMLSRPSRAVGAERARGERAYSMANLANADGIWQFQVKRVPDGRVSTWIVDDLARGDRVEVDGPYGHAHLQPADRDVVCIAGGSGLAPMVSIARGVAGRNDAHRRRVDFFYGGRNERDMCARPFLDEVSTSLRYSTLTEAISEEPGAGWNGATGFIHDVVAAADIPDLADREIYVAGPPVMTDAVMRLLVLHREVPADQVHFDRFF